MTKQQKRVFHKQLHFFAVDIFGKMCDDDCRIKWVFQQKCSRIFSGVSLVLNDLQAYGRLRMLAGHLRSPDASRHLQALFSMTGEKCYQMKPWVTCIYVETQMLKKRDTHRGRLRNWYTAL